MRRCNPQKAIITSATAPIASNKRTASGMTNQFRRTENVPVESTLTKVQSRETGWSPKERWSGETAAGIDRLLLSHNLLRIPTCQSEQTVNMASRNISDMVCPGCRSVYRRSLRSSARPETGQFSCSTCGALIAQWHTPLVPIYTRSDQADLLSTKPVEFPRNTKFGFARAIANEICEAGTDLPFFQHNLRSS